MPVGNNQKGYEAISIKPLHIHQPRLYFNSIITEYSDSWSPRWSPANVYGRMDPVSTYAGTSRELVLGFRVVSDTSDEARENMLKIEKLIQYQYPSYQKGSGGTKIMNSPPYFEFTFLNLLNSSKTTGSKLTGYINGAVQINPGFQAKEQAQFFNSSFSQLYFSDVTITLRLQVLHEGTIGWSNSSFSHRNYPYGIDAGTTTAAAPAPAVQPDPATPVIPGVPPQPSDTSETSYFDSLQENWAQFSETAGNELDNFKKSVAAAYDSAAQAVRGAVESLETLNQRQSTKKESDLTQAKGGQSQSLPSDPAGNMTPPEVLQSFVKNNKGEGK